jgi:hypothetical protein
VTGAYTRSGRPAERGDLTQRMETTAVAFDVNGTLVRILADDHEERISRAARDPLKILGAP